MTNHFVFSTDELTALAFYWGEIWMSHKQYRKEYNLDSLNQPPQSQFTETIFS